jgi:hypothetical protein
MYPRGTLFPERIGSATKLPSSARHQDRDRSLQSRFFDDRCVKNSITILSFGFAA